LITVIGLLSAFGIVIVPIVVWIKTKGQKRRLLKALGSSFACFVLMLVMVGIDTPSRNTLQAKTTQQTSTQTTTQTSTQTQDKQQPAEQPKTAEVKKVEKPAQNGGKTESSIASEYKVGDTGLHGVIMTESLIQYLSEAEKHPVKTKDEAENLTKAVYNDITDKDGTIMPEKEMMTKLYQAQVYYDKNMNSEYSSVNGLLIEEFGGRINKTRGVSGAAQRMNGITTMYEMVTSLRS
jgi:hypothetical protein